MQKQHSFLNGITSKKVAVYYAVYCEDPVQLYGKLLQKREHGD